MDGRKLSFCVGLCLRVLRGLDNARRQRSGSPKRGRGGFSLVHDRVDLRDILCVSFGFSLLSLVRSADCFVRLLWQIAPLHSHV